MRKITRLAACAFIEGRSFRKDNTSVTVSEYHIKFEGRTKEEVLATHERYGTTIHNQRMYLHGNLIAENTNAKGLRITLAGWPTNTTRERLNGLLTELGKREGVWQRNHEQYYGTHEDNIEIDSNEWITVELVNIINKVS